MAHLPETRVQQFSRVGVVYAGHFTMREQCLRKTHIHKAYIAVFVRFDVKASIEMVSELSTEAFLVAFDSFSGLPAAICADRGTNFIGAAKQLRQLIRIAPELQ